MLVTVRGTQSTNDGAGLSAPCGSCSLSPSPMVDSGVCNLDHSSLCRVGTDALSWLSHCDLTAHCSYHTSM